MTPGEWMSEDCQTIATYLPDFDAVRIAQVHDEACHTVYVDIADWLAIERLFPEPDDA